jgi:predicted HTH domain antitoxin
MTVVQAILACYPAAGMTITIDLPLNLDEGSIRQLEKDAREAVAARLYREHQLSHGQLAKFLGIGRGQVDEVLARHEPFDEFTAEEIAQQAQSLERLRKAGAG